ncbi:MAG: class I SAM-dependent methyltransferase [Candidatus Thorarchaeota archaeon]
MSERWKEYLTRISGQDAIIPPDYKYPVTDEATDTRLKEQDPNKHTVEQTLIAKLLDQNWTVAIDFGCGTGAHFLLFDQHGRSDGLLIGVDPDCSRAAMAREVQLGRIESLVLCGGIEILENLPGGLSVDMILCSQVLGHVSETQVKRIVQGFSQILRPGGHCCIAVPVIGEAFKKAPAARDWDVKGDFTHQVNMTLAPSDPSYRDQISLAEFNRYADDPVPGMLPVRSFLIPDFPDLSRLKLPHTLDELPPTIASLVNGLFIMEEAFIYSIHIDVPEIACPVGDAMIFLRKG